MRGKVIFQNAAEGFFRPTGRGTIVVGEIKMRNAEIKGLSSDGGANLKGVSAAEVVPEP